MKLRKNLEGGCRHYNRFIQAIKGIEKKTHNVEVKAIH